MRSIRTVRQRASDVYLHRCLMRAKSNCVPYLVNALHSPRSHRPSPVQSVRCPRFFVSQSCWFILRFGLLLPYLFFLRTNGSRWRDLRKEKKRRKEKQSRTKDVEGKNGGQAFAAILSSFERLSHSHESASGEEYGPIDFISLFFFFFDASSTLLLFFVISLSFLFAAFNSVVFGSENDRRNHHLFMWRPSDLYLCTVDSAHTRTHSCGCIYPVRSVNNISFQWHLQFWEWEQQSRCIGNWLEDAFRINKRRVESFALAWRQSISSLFYFYSRHQRIFHVVVVVLFWLVGQLSCSECLQLLALSLTLSPSPNRFGQFSVAFLFPWWSSSMAVAATTPSFASFALSCLIESACIWVHSKITHFDAFCKTFLSGEEIIEARQWASTSLFLFTSLRCSVWMHSSTEKDAKIAPINSIGVCVCVCMSINELASSTDRR